MKASLIIPTYNRGDILCNTIKQALEQSFDDYEVIVIDQTPFHEPAVQEFLDSVRDRIRYYKLPYPNANAARNFGIHMANGEIVIFIDDDVIIPKDYVATHVRNYCNERVGGVVGLTLPSEDVDLKDFLAAARCVFDISRELKIGDQALVSWTNSCNTSFRRTAIEEAGMFDEYLGTWCDDADMSVRVRGLGYQLLLDTRIKLIHLALPLGGGENRNPKIAEQKETERLVFSTYFMLKNRHIIGAWPLFRALFRAYRRYTLNRATISKGPYELIRKHLMYIKSTKEALVDLMKRRQGTPLQKG